MSNILCIYHFPCADGFTAAWVVKQAHPDAELVGAKYGDAPPDVTGRDVVIVDFSYKRDVLKSIINAANSVTILDHHKTAAEDLAGLESDACVVFDMNRSGAMIAWNHFFPFREAPQLVKYVQDRDLWRFELESSREVSACIFSYEYTLENWNQLATSCEHPNTLAWGVIQPGAAILRKHDKDLAELLKSCTRTMVIGGQGVPTANLPYGMASDAGNILAKESPCGFGATYFDSANGRKFSLRSVGDVDVAKIAERYGGGGHKNASGFTVPLGWEGDF